MRHNNIAWIDLLRIIACFLVVLAHCCDPFVGRFDTDFTQFTAGALWGSFYRACVPLFVMISGVLLLPVEIEATQFYRRRMSKIILPLVFWSVVTPFIFYFYFNSGIQTQNPNVEPEAFSLGETLKNAYTWIFNFNYTTTPLWYLYMLIGLYLIMPILSSWLKQASKKDIRRILGIWIFTTFLPYIQMIAPLLGYDGTYGNPGILGVCDWNFFGTFYYFSGFAGYLILAYYLVKYPPEWSWKKTLSITVPLWVIGYAITFIGFMITQKYYPGDYSKLEIFWYFFTFNVLMMTVAVFIIVQKIKIRSSGFLRGLASLTFGIYLSHFFVVQAAYDIIYPVGFNPYLAIPSIAVLAFSLTAVAIWLLRKIPVFRKLT